MGNIPEEVLLYRIKQETLAREAAIAALLAALNTATAESQQKITAVASKLTATIGGRSVNSSAIAGVILTSQVAPGFAYASQLTLLEAKVSSDALLSVGRITELREVTATEFEAKAQQILTIQATFNASKAKFTEDILANANATSAVTSRTTTLEATVNNPTSGVVASSARITAEETTRATQTSALATRSTALEATVNNATTGVTATLARLVTEETTRATADTAVANRTTTLESTVNNATTGVAATSARLTTEETTRATQTLALATRATTLESTVNNPTTGVAAAIARITAEESTRASADSAISSSVTTLTSTVNGQSANITTLQNTTSTLSSSISTLQTTVSSQGVSITTAQSGANAAQTAANTAQNAANAAQNTANDKIKTFIQGTTPTALAVGDLWIDTANNNKIKRWSGSAWVDASDVRITTLSSSVDSIATANTTRDSTVANLTTTVSAQSTAISNAQGTANTASAAVTTEANARANADGTLSARASLSLDINGNIAGYKIGSSVDLTGAVTSEFSITADTFKIFNGSSKVSPFYVTGGVVHMTNVVADTIAANISITTPTIYGGWLKFNGESKVTSNVSYSLVRMNGGASDGRGSGGQVDVFGNDYGGYGGAVMLTPGDSGNGAVYIRDRWGSDKIWVDTGGTANIRQGSFVGTGTFDGSFSGSHSGSYSGTLYGVGFSNTGFNVHPGSDNYFVSGEDGGTYGAQSGAYLAFRVNGRTVWVPFFTALP